MGKEPAPSTSLRKFRWPELRFRYAREVRQHRDKFKQLRKLAQRGRHHTGLFRS
jgi:uncharacterized protein YeaO (DUF488 family)